MNLIGVLTEILVRKGGYSNSRFFSSVLSSTHTRTALVSTLAQAIRDYGMAGITIDWQFPGTEGVGCNTNRPNDIYNLLKFIKSLRRAVGPKIEISVTVAPVCATPFSLILRVES